MPKNALLLTPFTFIIVTGYVTLALVVTNIGSDLLSANLSHIDVWCSLLHSKQFSATAFRGPVLSSCTVETKFFIGQYFSSSPRFLQFYDQKIYGQVSDSTHIHS